MILDADELDAAQTYKLLIATIVPRAIGWASTLSADGVPNLAPFSFFTVVSRKPRVLGVGPAVLLVNGTRGGDGHWGDLVEQLAPNRTPVTLDYSRAGATTDDSA